MDTMKDTKMQPATDAVIEELRMLAEDLYVNGYNRYSSAMSQAADELEQLRAKVERMEKVIDALGSGLNAVAKERDDAKAAAENIALKLDYLRSKLETAENAQNEWLRANAPGGWIDNLRIENEALRAEVIHIKEAEFPRKAQAVADGWRGKCERLEAKIEAMEKQEPVAWTTKLALEYGASRLGFQVSGVNMWGENGVPLYALPGAKGE